MPRKELSQPSEANQDAQHSAVPRSLFLCWSRPEGVAFSLTKQQIAFIGLNSV